MNNGRTFLVTSLDFSTRIAVAKGPVRTDYYTSVRAYLTESVHNVVLQKSTPP